MLIPEFAGGLGNMMFQLASTYAIAKETGHHFGIIDIPKPPGIHSSMDYKENIFKDWYFFKTNLLPTERIMEVNAELIDLNLIKNIPDDKGITMVGYFQRYEYLESYKNEIMKLFDIPFHYELQQKYTDIENSYFIHVRRGDYVGNNFHEMNYTNYYKNAINKIGNGIAYVVSNDIEWCKNWDLLKDIPHRIIDENELDTLAIMINCGKGGIAVNSSFSWWGLYLNTNRPYLILPKQWYPHNIIRSDGYYFKNATIIDV